MSGTGKRIRVGVLGGAGDAGEGHIRGYQADPRADVRTISDVNSEKGRTRCDALGIADFAGSVEEVLDRDDIDAVSVCTPDHLHADHVVKSLQSGKHVLCEKPMCTSRSDAARIVAAVRETGLTFLGGHNYHFRPDFQAMVSAYRQGEIGDVWLTEGDYLSNLHRYYGADGRTPWRSDAAAPQNILSGGGCHPLGLMRWALGVEVAEVFAFSSNRAEPLMPIDDTYVMVMTFEDGTIGKLLAGGGNRGSAPTGGHLVMYGTTGTLWGGKLYRYDAQTNKSSVVKDFAAENALRPPRVSDTYQVHYWAEQAEHFLDCIEGRTQPLTDVVAAARVVAALSAGIESSRTGKPIKVDNSF